MTHLCNISTFLEIAEILSREYQTNQSDDISTVSFYQKQNIPSSSMETKARRRIKRFLFIGPTGVGKSTLINILFNDDVRPWSLLQPASTSESSAGVTACFSTYYSIPDCALTDSIGFGDNRFTKKETITMLKAVVKNSMVGYNKIYLCLRYGRVANDIRYYIDLLVAIFGKKILKWCTIIFTNCKHRDMTKESYLAKNQSDSYICGIINDVQNVIFGDNVTDEDPDMEKVCLKKRQALLNALKDDVQNSSTEYYLFSPDNIFEWMRTILDVIMSKSVREIQTYFQEIQVLSGTISTLMINQNFANYYGQCTICFEDMWDKDSIFTTCGHIFHKDCIDRWLKEKAKNCPICRASLDRSDAFLTSLAFEDDKKKS